MSQNQLHSGLMWQKITSQTVKGGVASANPRSVSHTHLVTKIPCTLWFPSNLPTNKHNYHVASVDHGALLSLCYEA